MTVSNVRLAGVAALALILPGAVPAQAQSAYRLTCEMVQQSTTSSPGRPAMENETPYTQVYTVDPASRSVTRRYAYDDKAKDWVENPQTFTDIRVMNEFQLSFCEDAVDAGSKTVRQRGATTVETIREPMTIDLETGRASNRLSIYGYNAQTSLRSESRFRGTCRRL